MKAESSVRKVKENFLRFNQLTKFFVMLKAKLINRKRIESITMDTGTVLVQTCRGLLELNKHFFNTLSQDDCEIFNHLHKLLD